MSSLLAINVQYNQSERQQWSEGINKESSEILIMSSEEGLEEGTRDIRDLNLSKDVNLLKYTYVVRQAGLMQLSEELMTEIHCIELSFGEPGIAPITVAICEEVCTKSVS